MKNDTVELTKNAKEVVLAFIDAMNKEDFTSARKYLATDMTFKGVLGARDGAEAYMNDMEKMKFKYDLKNTVAEGDDVCLFYDIDMGRVTIFGCGWYQVKDGKISSFRVIFDPRPVLELSNKN
ncbi:nuclear transport factor 2 family protein [Mucilaginibacter sp. HC2]|uniref:nuclear transport factor 2 family protein n=1 Tax=Mucilaginibacter inviolabilis TaxID=2714892 RepID=UPI00140BDDF7|nr:nuclear transport factor 2 family protein [Mucilaginibacter inviolabilis]NHA04427.1 nuclear transport factor 2 family protein [Mucilaginibacter inviolabilis]